MTTHTYASSTHNVRIQEICLRREISVITHFTRAENLASILHSGLLSKEELRKRNISAFTNDQLRLDRQPQAICLSISFPNYQMFFRYRNDNSQHKWVVLALDARILWESDCAFCFTNAASNIIRNIPIAQRKQVEAFEHMFDNYSGNGSEVRREGLFLPKNYPTNPQAEILAFKPIPLKYLKHIYVEKRSEAVAIAQDLSPELASIPVSVNSSFFRARDDYEVWKSTRQTIEAV